ncbi:M20 family metallopeptidase [Streptomyces sp. DT24]|uniref:M20 family metallopeptidase n=1 Tax=Streptomyces sp. DT24 TaxID=3416520 RepID=UPI003CE977DC
MFPLAPDEIRDRTVTHADALLELLAESVRRPSESGWEDRVDGLYLDWFAEHGWQAERLPLAASATENRAEERANVLAWWPRRRGRPVVVLNGHMDVVPARQEDGWSRPPYDGARADGLVHGRGSTDMKGGIASGLLALTALADAGFDPPFDIAVQLVAGEETTGIGTRTLLEGFPRPAAALVLEPTDCVIVPVSTGLQFFTVDVAGRSAHTSAPWRGVDAFDRLLRVRAALLDLAERRGAAYRHPLFADVPTAIPFAIGTVAAGHWRAAVPASATMSGRIGVRPGESLEAVRAEFLAAVAAAPADDPSLPAPEVRWDHGLLGWETAQDHPLIKALAAARETVLGEPRFTGFTAGSDAACFGAAGVPTAVFGPGQVSRAHGPDESVAEADVVAAADVLALALTRLDTESLR